MVTGGVVLITVLSFAPAFAPCVIGGPPNAEDALKTADVAVVGVRYKQAKLRIPNSALDTKYSFLVEWSVKGKVERRIDVFASEQFNGCWTQANPIPFGTRVGLILHRDDGHWYAGPGNPFNADELLSLVPAGSTRKLGSASYFHALWFRAQFGAAPIVLGVLLVVPLALFGARLVMRRRSRRRAAFSQPAP